jgi:hypothetical protein
MPPSWLHANITPVSRKDGASDPSNYGSIALTCIMCKLMEFIIKDQLLCYLVSKNLKSKQHAFIIKQSTTTNLLECLLDWSVALNAGNSVEVIFISTFDMRLTALFIPNYDINYSNTVLMGNYWFGSQHFCITVLGVP